MIIYGSRLFGKVDEVPGLGHVATKFGHINYLPLIPLQGWLVAAQDGNSWSGQPIRMSGKSVLVAYARAAFVLFTIGCAIAALAGFGNEGAAGTVGPGVVAALCVGGLIASYKWSWVTRASPERALELATEAGVGEEGLARLRQAYGAPAPAVAPARPWTPPE